jgi:tetratricopeptide (TPR) repeat protein
VGYTFESDGHIYTVIELMGEGQTALAYLAKSPTTEQDLVVKHIKAGDPVSDAQSQYNRLVRNAVENSDARLLLRVCNIYLEVLEPNSHEAHFNCAHAHLQLDEIDAAVPHLMAALEQEPDDFDCLWTLAGVSAQLGKGSEAVHYLSAAARVDRDALGRRLSSMPKLRLVIADCLERAERLEGFEDLLLEPPKTLGLFQRIRRAFRADVS